MSTFSEGSDSVRKWATTVVLMAILSLAALAFMDSRGATEQNTKDIRVLVVSDAAMKAEHELRLALLEDHYATIKNDLAAIKSAVSAGQYARRGGVRAKHSTHPTDDGVLDDTNQE